MQDIARLERKIHRLRAEMLDVYVSYVGSLDEQTQWPKIVDEARAAGLSKDDLCRELGCAWSTITRWRAGQTAPGPFHRAAIKAKLVEMLGATRDSEREKVGPERLVGVVHVGEIKEIIQEGTRTYKPPRGPWPAPEVKYGPSKDGRLGPRTQVIAQG